MTEPGGKRDARMTHEGPSWGLMLFLIFLAMLLALGIAWAFISHFFQPR